MADIFLSYSSDDRLRAARLAEALQGEGWSVWWDHEIPPGQTWAESIRGALEGAETVVVLWSKTSVESRWVQKEARYGLDSGVLVPVLIDEIAPPFEFDDIQAARLTDWTGSEFEAGVERLARAIRRHGAASSPGGEGLTATADRSPDAPMASAAPAQSGTSARLVRVLWHEATLVGITLMLAAAAAWTLIRADEPPPPITPSASLEMSAADRIFSSADGLRDSTRVVVRTQAIWDDVWVRAVAGIASPPPVPMIDFEREMVVVVASGQATPGDRIAVESVRGEGVITGGGSRELRLRVFVATIPNCDDSPGGVFPTEIVRLPRFDGEVVFEETRTECQSP